MTEAIARSLYARPQPQTQGQPAVPPITYSRAFFEGPTLTSSVRDRFVSRAAGLTDRGALPNHSVLVVGSAFGWTLEHLTNLGVSDVWGIEPGSYLWNAPDSEWAAGMKVRTANDWIGSGTEVDSLNAIGVSGQARFNWILDEDAAPAHTDTELPTFYAALEDRLQGNNLARIVHVVTPIRPDGIPGDSSQNWKTLTEWEATAPAHTWVDARSL